MTAVHAGTDRGSLALRVIALLVLLASAGRATAQSGGRTPRSAEQSTAPAGVTPAGVPPAGAAAAAPTPPRSGRTAIVVPDAAVSVGRDTQPVLEPHLAINPRNAAHLVAGAAVIDRPDLVNGDAPAGVSRSHCVSLVSFDGGRRWTTHAFTVPDCLDPWVAVHPAGAAFFAMISTTGSRLLVYRSPDGGRTWAPTPADFGPGHDHATLAVDTTGGPRHGTIYVVSRQDVRRAGSAPRSHAYVARSVDEGRTWDTTRVLPFSLAMNTMSSAVLSDGALVVPLSTFGPPLGDAEWFITSSDGARTFAEPVAAHRACSKSFPHLTADGSRGPFRDRLYYVCNDSAYARILVFRSEDRAQRWAAPAVANAAASASPPAAAPPYARTAVAAVNAAGVLGVSWYDARHDPDVGKGRDRCQELVFAASLDGGRTFLPDVPVSTGRNCPATPRNGPAGARWRAGGDYHGLVAAPGGRFHLLWADSRSGVYQLRFATVRVEGTATRPAAEPPPP
jgi:hypothetical protein